MEEKDSFKLFTIQLDTLEQYGFKRENGLYTFSTLIVDNDFRLIVEIDDLKRVYTKVIDVFSEEEYILHRVKGVKGKYATNVKEAYEQVLDDIKAHCAIKEMFKSDTTKAVIQYVREKYNTELEFPWGDDSQAAVFRRADSGKWYALIMTISKSKLGYDSDEKIELMNLKGNPMDVVDQVHYFPAYHMSKKYWYTIDLSSNINLEEIKQHLDLSYVLVGKN